MDIKTFHENMTKARTAGIVTAAIAPPLMVALALISQMDASPDLLAAIAEHGINCKGTDPWCLGAWPGWGL